MFVFSQKMLQIYFTAYGKVMKENLWNKKCFLRISIYYDVPTYAEKRFQSAVRLDIIKYYVKALLVHASYALLN